MITLKMSKPNGTTYVLGVTSEDLETLSKDGIITVELPYARVAVMQVKCSKDEFIDKLKAEAPVPVEVENTSPIILPPGTKLRD